jgi:hypothetical protein
LAKAFLVTCRAVTASFVGYQALLAEIRVGRVSTTGIKVDQALLVTTETGVILAFAVASWVTAVQKRSMLSSLVDSFRHFLLDFILSCCNGFLNFTDL